MFHTSNESATRKRLVTRVISLTSATALAVTTLVAVGATPASADAAPVVKSFDYAVKLETPGSSVSIPNPVYKRIDFQARFVYDDVTTLRGRVITVDSAETGFTQANRPMVYAFFTFKDANNVSIGNGSQINRVFSGQQLDNNNSITVPVNAVEMNINWTTAANISTANYGPVAAGTYSSTPKIFDRGTVASPESPTEIAYTSDAESIAGLYYEADGSQANVEGIATNFNLPVSGTIRRVHSTVVGCIDWSKVTSNTVANADFKVNGQAPDYSTVSTSDSANIYSGNPVNGSTLDFSTGDLASWRSQSKPIYVFAQYQEFDSSLITNGMAVDATLEVVDGSSVSILKDCTPSAPTGTGTLGAASMAGRLQYTPTTFVPPTGEWACNLYKKSDNALVATGSGWGNSPCMIGSYGPDAPAIPTGVPLYAKPVSSIKILGQSFSAVGATASNEYTMTSGGGSCPPVCGPPPPAVVPVGFIPPKVIWPATSLLKVGSKMTAVKSNLPGTRILNWVRCPSSLVRNAGTVTNGSVFPGTGIGCEVLSAAGVWTPSAQLNESFRAFTGTTYTVKSSDAGKNFSIIDFARCTGQCSGSSPALSKTVKVNDKVEPNYPVTGATLKRNAKFNIPVKNNQALSLVVTTTTASKCTVAKAKDGKNYVVTGKALGICLVKISVTGNSKIANGIEVRAVTIN